MQKKRLDSFILTVPLLFALVFFKDSQKYNDPPIYEGHVPSV